jgi:hypothetical protein
MIDLKKMPGRGSLETRKESEWIDPRAFLWIKRWHMRFNERQLGKFNLPNLRILRNRLNYAVGLGGPGWAFATMIVALRINLSFIV